MPVSCIDHNSVHSGFYKLRTNDPDRLAVLQRALEVLLLGLHERLGRARDRLRALPLDLAAINIARGRDTGKLVVATLPGCEDRDAAEAMRGTEIWVPREVLPPPAPGEYYWVDLEGLRVRNTDGADFGVVSHLFSTGANDVLVARGERERMIPFLLPDYVVSVDFDAGCVTVDWDADF